MTHVMKPIAGLSCNFPCDFHFWLRMMEAQLLNARKTAGRKPAAKSLMICLAYNSLLPIDKSLTFGSSASTTGLTERLFGVALLLAVVTVAAGETSPDGAGFLAGSAALAGFLPAAAGFAGVAAFLENIKAASKGSKEKITT